MKRTALEKHLRAHGCSLLRHGGNHDIWTNALAEAESAIPRHSEIRKHLTPIH